MRPQLNSGTLGGRMRIVAVLLPGANQPAINDAAWESLMQTRAPASPQVRRGINPFTKKPIELPQRRYSGLRVIDRGKEIGSIEWAQDGSNMLLVRLEDDHEAASEALVTVAQDVASALGVVCDVQHEMVVFSRRDDHVPPAEEPLEKAIRLWKAGDGERAVAHYMASFNVDLPTAVRDLKDFAASHRSDG
jgi:hypothetical protein